MKKISLYLAVFVFTFYWFITLTFVSPKNYITIKLYEEEQFFNTFFFQKWSFFAPPPKHNDRLYFEFESKKDTTDFFVFEVIQPIQKRKSKKAPFNSSEDVLDYLLSSSLHSISDALIAVNETFDYKNSAPDSIAISDNNLSKKIEESKKYIQKLPSFQTLINYGVFTAEKNNIKNIYDYNLTIRIIQSNMPKFADRSKLDDNEYSKGKLIFESDKLPL